MKSFGLYLLNFALLAMLVSCGKDNESGKSSWNYNGNYNSQYGYGGSYGQYGSGYYNYAYNNYNVQAIMNPALHPCYQTGFPNMRTTVQFPLTGFQSFLQNGEIYAGVTSYGDVAYIIGRANNPPLFVAQLCQRGMYSTGQGQLVDLALGTYSKCAFKQLTRATMIIPGLQQPLYFRMLEGGSSLGQRFPFCSP